MLTSDREHLKARFIEARDDYHNELLEWARARTEWLGGECYSAKASVHRASEHLSEFVDELLDELDRLEEIAHNALRNEVAP